jgi:phospholipid N-methyltransferase
MSKFLSSFLRHPIATGAIAPSSTHLAREMVSWIDWNDVATCVEFGPGTGAFTPSILESMNRGTRFFTVELNPDFAATMQRHFPEVETLCRSVEEIDQICAERSVSQIDCIVCGLPWAAFATDLQNRLMQAVLSRMPKDGYFCTFAYLQGTLLPAGIRFKHLLRESFSSVERSRTVWRNLPPAFVYQCRTG